MDDINKAEFNEWVDWYNALPANHQAVTMELVKFLMTAGTAKEACKTAREMIEKLSK